MAKPARDGSIWVTTWRGRKAFRFDPVGISTSYSHPDTLRGGLETTDGSVWFHTPHQAVRFKDGAWLGHTPLDGGVIGLYRTSGDAIWFRGIHKGMQAVAQYRETGWRIYTEAEGIPSGSSRFLEMPDGRLWLVGLREESLTACRFDGLSWRQIAEVEVPGGAFIRKAYAATDSTLWVSTELIEDVGRVEDTRIETGEGVYRFNGQTWNYYGESEGLSDRVLDMAEWPVGTLWLGTQYGLSRVDLSAVADRSAWWHKRDFPGPKHHSKDIHGLLPTEDALWFGFAPTRQMGIYRYDGKTWRNYTEADGLVGNEVDDIMQASDGAIWCTNPNGLSRFDGANWFRYTADDGLRIKGKDEFQKYVTMREMRDGSFWIDNREGRMIHFRCGAGQRPPETILEGATERVSSVGNILLAWEGRDLWDETPDGDLRYQWRLDAEDWSIAERSRQHTFTSLYEGPHRFEVRTMDRDGNVDPTPAVHAFVVEGPWWKNPWVFGLVVVFVLVTGVQTARVVRRDRRLRESNAALSDANRELFDANVQIQEQTERKSRFLASMSHELRTPMNAIIGFTRLVLRRSGDLLPERQRDNLEKVQVSADNLLGLINDLLDLSKIEAGRMDVTAAPFDMKKMVLGCCATMGPLVKPGVKLHCNVDDGIGMPNTDEGKVRQIVMNLLSNAVKFTEEGEIRVTVGHCQLERYQLTIAGGREPVKGMEIAVSDTGAGIPEAALGTIFEEFEQVSGANAQHKGTGLGLTLVKRFSELLGGSVGVRSEVGKGSEFMVRIPRMYQKK